MLQNPIDIVIKEVCEKRQIENLHLGIPHPSPTCNNEWNSFDLIRSAAFFATKQEIWHWGLNSLIYLPLLLYKGSPFNSHWYIAQFLKKAIAFQIFQNKHNILCIAAWVKQGQTNLNKVWQSKIKFLTLYKFFT